jgi:hypothetical protein
VRTDIPADSDLLYELHYFVKNGGLNGLAFLKNKFLLNATNSIVWVLFRSVREREKAEENHCEIGAHSGKVTKEKLTIEILTNFK